MKLNKLSSLRGQGLTEYALALVLVGLLFVAVNALFPGVLAGVFGAIGAWINGLIP